MKVLRNASALLFVTTLIVAGPPAAQLDARGCSVNYGSRGVSWHDCDQSCEDMFVNVCIPYCNGVYVPACSEPGPPSAGSCECTGS